MSGSVAEKIAVLRKYLTDYAGHMAGRDGLLAALAVVEAVAEEDGAFGYMPDGERIQAALDAFAETDY